MPEAHLTTSEHEDDEVEVLYDIIEEILEKDGKVTQTPSKWENGILFLEMNHVGAFLDHMD